MSLIARLAVQCLVIVAASLAGGWVPLMVRLTHRRLELLLSIVSGVMLGVALLHLLPHAWMQHADGGEAAGHRSVTPVAGWLLVGFLSMFFVERFFCFHHHDAPSDATLPDGHHRLSWTAAAIGLAVHSLVEGVALGAAVKTQHTSGAMGWAAGLGAFLAIVLHKPFDSMTIGALMAAGRRSAGARHLINGAFGLVVPFGVALFFVGAGTALNGSALMSAALAFSAGTFLCISLSDLLPELQFHSHDRVKLSVALLLGVAVAWAAALLETAAHD